MADNLTLDELRAKIPARLWDQFDQFAAILETMSREQIASLIERLKYGHLAEAYGEIIKHLSGDELVGQWDSINAKWQVANDKQVERKEAAQKLALGISEFFLKIALAGVLF